MNKYNDEEIINRSMYRYKRVHAYKDDDGNEPEWNYAFYNDIMNYDTRDFEQKYHIDAEKYFYPFYKLYIYLSNLEGMDWRHMDYCPNDNLSYYYESELPFDKNEMLDRLCYISDYLTKQKIDYIVPDFCGHRIQDKLYPTLINCESHYNSEPVKFHGINIGLDRRTYVFIKKESGLLSKVNDMLNAIKQIKEYAKQYNSSTMVSDFCNLVKSSIVYETITNFDLNIIVNKQESDESRIFHNNPYFEDDKGVFLKKEENYLKQESTEIKKLLQKIKIRARII